MQNTLFIKKVVMNDFLTFKKANFFKDNEFSSGCNILLGKNGSGKSSLLKAIMFVMSDRYNNLTKQ